MLGNPHVRFDERDVEPGAMVGPLRHRQTKGAETDMPGLPPPRHFPTLPIHIPFFFEVAILSRMRSPMTSRSNCAKDNRTLRVKRPIEVVVLNCCVTDTKEAPLASRT